MAAKQCKTWSMGQNTLEVPLELFALNRKRLAKHIDPESVVLLQGGGEIDLYDTDVHYIFRQESYFQWCCGVREPGCFLIIQGGTGAATLFVPHLPEEYAVWMGKLHTLEDFKETYCVEEVYYADELKNVLKGKKPQKVLTLKGINSDSKLECKEACFEGINEFNVDNSTLFPIIAELRVFKTDMEKDVMRYVAKVSSDAHKEVMLYTKPGASEYQCEAVFLKHCYEKGGCRHVSYTCICGSGCNSAILHYGHAGAPNCKQIKQGDMCLYDMGANYAGYAADITCTFPANGKFTENQKLVYNAVLAARNAVLRELKPGVSWPDMHLLANRAMLQYLKDGGLLKGDVEDMMKAGINGILQPHGLGHFIGLDVHDVGGYLKTCPPRRSGTLAALRTARTMQAGMAITVEPGCYFIDVLLDKAVANPDVSKFFNLDLLKQLRGSGGVRIEDDVLITETGNENMTFVPRTVEEIEDWMKNGANFK